MTDDLAKWLLTQLDPRNPPALHTAGCLTVRQPLPPSAAELVDGPRVCDCDAIDVWRADIESKRRLVALHETVVVRRYNVPTGQVDAVNYCSFCTRDIGDVYPCRHLKLLALPLAGRPGYRDEWRP